MDLNSDGHVSYDELSDFIDGIGAGRDAKKDVTFAKALKKHFDDLDKSGEGDLSKKEVKQALQSLFHLLLRQVALARLVEVIEVLLERLREGHVLLRVAAGPDPVDEVRQLVVGHVAVAVQVHVPK